MNGIVERHFDMLLRQAGIHRYMVSNNLLGHMINEIGQELVKNTYYLLHTILRSGEVMVGRSSGVVEP